MLGATQRKQRGIKEETDGSFKPWIEKLERGVAQVSKAFGGRGRQAGRREGAGGVWWVAPASALILSCSRVCAGVSSGSIQSPYNSSGNNRARGGAGATSKRSGGGSAQEGTTQHGAIPILTETRQLCSQVLAGLRLG